MAKAATSVSSKSVRNTSVSVSKRKANSNGAPRRRLLSLSKSFYDRLYDYISNNVEQIERSLSNELNKYVREFSACFRKPLVTSFYPTLTVERTDTSFWDGQFIVVIYLPVKLSVEFAMGLDNYVKPSYECSVAFPFVLKQREDCSLYWDMDDPWIPCCDVVPADIYFGKEMRLVSLAWEEVSKRFLDRIRREHDRSKK